MKSRFLVLSLLVFGVMAVTAVASRESGATRKSWTMVNFADPVLVANRIVMGPVLIVHDDKKMEEGDACTTFYHFDPSRGPQEEIVSFHCTPVYRDTVGTTQLTLSEPKEPGCKRLLEYQIAGEAEAHGVPIK